MIKNLNDFILNESFDLLKIGMSYKIMQEIQKKFQIKKINKLDRKNKTNIMNIYYKKNLLIIFNKENNTWDILFKFRDKKGWTLKRYDKEKKIYGHYDERSIYNEYVKDLDLNNLEIFYAEKDDYKFYNKSDDIYNKYNNEIRELRDYYNKIYPSKIVNILEKKYYELRNAIESYYMETTENIENLNNLNYEQSGMLKNIGNILVDYVNNYTDKKKFKFSEESFSRYLSNNYNIQYKNENDKRKNILELMEHKNKEEILRGYSIYMMKFKLDSINKIIERYKNINIELKTVDYNI